MAKLAVCQKVDTYLKSKNKLVLLGICLKTHGKVRFLRLELNIGRAKGYIYVIQLQVNQIRCSSLSTLLKSCHSNLHAFKKNIWSEPYTFHIGICNSHRKIHWHHAKIPQPSAFLNANNASLPQQKKKYIISEFFKNF